MIFPTWRYHRTFDARIFQTADELAIAGDGWVDHPSQLEEPEPEPEPTKTKTRKGKQS